MKNILVKGFILILLYCIVLPTSIFATSYYVSPSGNDSNIGTETMPFLSLQRAKDKVREEILIGLKEDVHIILREGIYRLEEPLFFTVLDSGTDTFKISYENYPSENVVISGGKVIKNWVVQGNAWYTKLDTSIKVPKQWQIWINDKRGIRARKTVEGWEKNELGYNTVSSPLVVAKPQELEIVDRVLWKEWRCLGQSLNENQFNIEPTCWDSANTIRSGIPTIGIPDWVENAKEFVDSPGEWYADKNTNEIIYYPRDGETIETAEVIVPVLENLVNIIGTSVQTVKNITFKGIKFSHANWSTPPKNIGFPRRTTPWQFGAIQMVYTNKINFIDSVFTHLSVTALSIMDGTKDMLVEGSIFTDITTNGLTLMNTPDSTPNINSVDVISNVIIKNNYIYNIASEFNGNYGMSIQFGDNIQVTNNTFFDLPYVGIQFGWTNQGINPSEAFRGSNIISNNLISRHMSIMKGSGGIHTTGGQIATEGTQGTVIEENVILDQPDQTGAIHLDGASRYMTIKRNVLFNNFRSLLGKGGSNNYIGNYWQDRIFPEIFPPYTEPFPDVWIKVTKDCPTATGVEDCGANKKDGNIILKNAADIPEDILKKAGVQCPYRDKIDPNISTVAKYRLPCLATSIVGDANGDSHVDQLDFDIWLKNYNLFVSTSINGDFDNNNKVDGIDYVLWLQNVGK